MNNESRLRVAVQKSGRLADNSRDLLVRCGLRFSRDNDRLIWAGENLAIDLLLVRDDDIPGLVEEGICELGIVGGNVFEETRLGRVRRELEPGFRALKPLDFGRCRLSIAVPRDAGIVERGQVDGLRIATTYPNILRDWLGRQRLAAEAVPMSGSVEIAPRLGKADLVCDLVSTGATLAANDLDELESIFESQALLIGTTRSMCDTRRELRDRLLQRIDGVLQVRESKYVMLHAPRAALDEIKALLPGSEAPTVMQLDGCDDKVAVHAVCNEYVFWETLEALKLAGASSMLVLPVEKMLA